MLLPPSSIATPIEAVRRVHDKHFARWPPHINLIYPFLASPSETNEQGDATTPRLKQEISTRIQTVARSVDPFSVALHADPPGTFTHSQRSKTVWLGPSTQSIHRLQVALQAEFSECDADQRLFTPHLSVGQASSESKAQLLGEEIKQSVRDFLTKHEENKPIALEWYVDKIFVIERKGFKDRFKVVGSIELRQS